MASQEVLKSKDEILKSFKLLSQRHEQQAALIATRAQEAEKAREAALVEKATTYTVESIINGLASLQLSFSDELERLAQTLQVESSKLEELQRAITIEEARLGELRNIQVAAEALAIQARENKDELAAFKADATHQHTELETEISDTRAQWQREAEEHQAALVAYEAELKKARAQEEADFQYELERKRKIELDKREDRKRAQEREIADTDAVKAREWAAREQVLADAAAELQALRDKAAAFPAELEAEVNATREDAIKKATAEAKITSELEEKEWQGNFEVFELRIASLEATITSQTAQIEKLQSQLHEAAQQSQQLAVKAIEGASKSK